jgi:Sulfotransferase family
MWDFVYLTSANYSGSTLMTFLLNTHPGVITIGELKGASKDPETHLCSCGTAIGRCPFWTALLEHMHANGVPFDHADVWSQCGFRIPGSAFANRVVRHYHRAWPLEVARDLFIRLSPSCRRAFEKILRTNEAFVAAAHSVAPGSLFLDSSKDPIRLKYLRRSKSLRIKVISMIRDGRGVMNSAMKRLGCSAEEGATEWVRREQEMRRVTSGMDDANRIMVRYEDLCASPDETLGRVFRFMGLDPADANLDFRNVEHHILGNAMRFATSSDIKLDTKWTRELTQEQLDVFERIGGAVNRRYGYTSESRSASPVATADCL